MNMTTTIKRFFPESGLSACRALLTAAALTSASLGAQAQVQTVLNAYQDINGNFLSPPVFAYNCFTCTAPALNLNEIGDIVTLGGTQRTLNTATVMVGQFATATPFAAYTANVTFSVYSVTGIGPTPTVTLLGSQTNAYNITSSNAIYDLDFNFAGMGIVMPDTIYYGVSVSSASPQIAGLRLALFDYLDPLNSGTGTVGTVAPGSLQAGTDPGTVVNSLSPLNISSVMYARTALNPGQVVQTQPGLVGGTSINTGFTPAVLVTAVPEPQTYALMLLGIGAVLAFTAKRRKA